MVSNSVNVLASASTVFCLRTTRSSKGTCRQVSNRTHNTDDIRTNEGRIGCLGSDVAYPVHFELDLFRCQLHLPHTRFLGPSATDLTCKGEATKRTRQHDDLTRAGKDRAQSRLLAFSILRSKAATNSSRVAVDSCKRKRALSQICFCANVASWTTARTFTRVAVNSKNRSARVTAVRHSRARQRDYETNHGIVSNKDG